MDIRVVVVGATGKMGREVIKAVHNERNLLLVGAIDSFGVGEDIGVLAGIGGLGIEVQGDLAAVLVETKVDVVVDFTNPSSVCNNIKTALQAGVNCVVGTTGISQDQIKEINNLSTEKGLGVLIAPNFAIGAVLMMRFAAQAAKYMPHVEIIEMHHDHKLDAPSGTALKTAEAIMQVRENFRQGNICEEEAVSGARGGEYDGFRIHSVRLPGYVAHQEVIFGGQGQTLTIRHDSIHRESFMPGVIVGITKILNQKGVVYGLEHLLED